MIYGGDTGHTVIRRKFEKIETTPSTSSLQFPPNAIKIGRAARVGVNVNEEKLGKLTTDMITLKYVYA